MKTKITQTPPPDLTAPEAEALLARAGTNFTAGIDDLLTLKQRRGYLALGYESFQACIDARLDLTRQNVRSLLAIEEVRQNTGATVPASHAAVIITVVPEQQAAVLADAQQAADEDEEEVTAETVKQAAADKKKKKDDRPPVVSAKLRIARERIGDICGVEAVDFCDAQKFKETEMRFWADQEAAEILRLYAVMVARVSLRPTGAAKFLSQMPGTETPISDLVLIASLSGRDITVVQTGDYVTVCYKAREWPQLRDLVARCEK